LAAPCGNEMVEPQAEILGLLGSRLLVLQTCMDRPPVHSFDLIDLGLESGRSALSSYLAKGTTIVDAAMSADHSTVSITLADASGRLSVALGVEPGKLTIHALPPDAKAAAFVTARRGIAVGIHLGQLWGTVDGAATWFPLAPPVAGDPASIPITQRPTCTMLSCSTGADGSPVVWADARALRDTGFEQARLVAPGRAPADRAYPGLRPAHPIQIGYPDDRPKKSGCPESPTSSSRAAKHRH